MNSDSFKSALVNPGGAGVMTREDRDSLIPVVTMEDGIPVVKHQKMDKVEMDCLHTFWLEVERQEEYLEGWKCRAGFAPS
jgi:hypothetical protein